MIQIFHIASVLSAHRLAGSQPARAHERRDHFNWILNEFEASIDREPLIPMGAPLDHAPAPPKP